jgi:hypothetical protein
MIMWRELQPDDPGRIGPYRLRGVLGSGGMGRVFLGASADDQLVAVKVIRADLASDPEFRARFRREVTVARKVSSRFTVPLIDADVDGPMPWLATVYVPGPSLATSSMSAPATAAASATPTATPSAAMSSSAAPTASPTGTPATSSSPAPSASPSASISPAPGGSAAPSPAAS